MPNKMKPPIGKASELLQELREAAEERTEVMHHNQLEITRVRMPKTFLPAISTLHDHLVTKDASGTPVLDIRRLKAVSLALAGGDETVAKGVFDQLKRPWDDYSQFLDKNPAPPPDGFIT
jgi:hypothetical protein